MGPETEYPLAMLFVCHSSPLTGYSGCRGRYVPFGVVVAVLVGFCNRLVIDKCYPRRGRNTRVLSISWSDELLRRPATLSRVGLDIARWPTPQYTKEGLAPCSQFLRNAPG